MTSALLCITFVPMKDETIILRVERELKEDLQVLANKDDRSLSSYIVRVLKRTVDIEKAAKVKPSASRR